MPQLYQHMCLIGVGLIGSSLSQAARKAGLVGRISATARSAQTRDKVMDLGLADEVFENATSAVKDADLVVLCAPVGAFADIAAEIAPHLKPGATLSDVGSVKQAVFDAVQPHVPGNVHFIPAHPVAGTEQSGPESGFATLFSGRWCILTPPPDADEEAVARLGAFWQGLGAQLDRMEASHHDLVLAITSHLPHLIAYNIVGTAADLEDDTKSEVIKYSAGGFRDFTRIAASDPTMWRDIFLTNREAVLEILGRFTEDLAGLQRAIRRGDGEALFEKFTRTRGIRRSIIEAGQESDAPDFGRHSEVGD